jgi:hypothetical protein
VRGNSCTETNTDDARALMLVCTRYTAKISPEAGRATQAEIDRFRELSKRNGVLPRSSGWYQSMSALVLHARCTLAGKHVGNRASALVEQWSMPNRTEITEFCSNGSVITNLANVPDTVTPHAGQMTPSTAQTRCAACARAAASEAGQT